VFIVELNEASDQNVSEAVSSELGGCHWDCDTESDHSGE
jgi:hypothetical protein